MSDQPWGHKELENPDPNLVIMHFRFSIAKSKECAKPWYNIENKTNDSNAFGNIWDFEDE